MIEISMETAFILYLGLMVFCIIGLWLRAYFRSKSKEILIIPKKTMHCEFCHTSYIDDPVKAFTRCPECQSLNRNR